MMSHRQTNTPEYVIWAQMRRRCGTPGNHAYDRYGGRGISVCDRWNDFAMFIADMGKRPSPAHSLDRIDNNGHYEKSNCRWATIGEQSNNKRSNIRLTLNGETLTLAQWSERLGISYKVLHARHYRLKWGALEVLTRPVGRWV